MRGQWVSKGCKVIALHEVDQGSIPSYGPSYGLPSLAKSDPKARPWLSPEHSEYGPQTKQFSSHEQKLPINGNKNILLFIDQIWKYWYIFFHKKGKGHN